MTFEEIESLRRENFTDVDGTPCPLPSPESIAAARRIYAAVTALGPVPEGAEVEADADLNGGCAVNLWGADGRHVWFYVSQDGAHGAIGSLRDPDGGVSSICKGGSVEEQAEAARRFVGWA